MVDKVQRILPETLWVYAYEFARPPEESQLNAIRALLEREHLTARRTARKWTGKLVCERRLTHILVVSDSPDQSREVNHRLESRLKLLQATFSLTVPMALPDDETPSPDGGGTAPQHHLDLDDGTHGGRRDPQDPRGGLGGESKPG